MFRWWHRVRDGTLSRADFQRRMRPVERAIRETLWYGGRSEDARTRGTCRDILKHDTALFTLVHQDGVPPTNNAAERSLRHAVIWRKGSFGTRSPDGSAFVSRILTVITTLRQQGRHRYLDAWRTPPQDSHGRCRASPRMVRSISSSMA